MKKLRIDKGFSIHKSMFLMSMVIDILDKSATTNNSFSSRFCHRKSVIRQTIDISYCTQKNKNIGLYIIVYWGLDAIINNSFSSRFVTENLL